MDPKRHISGYLNRLITGSTERLEAAYVCGIRKKIRFPAVFLFDLSDQTAREMLQNIAKEAETIVNEMLEHSRQKRYIIPTATSYLAINEAAGLLPGGNQQIERQLLRFENDYGTFPVIVVTKGSILLATVSVP